MNSDAGAEAAERQSGGAPVPGTLLPGGLTILASNSTPSDVLNLTLIRSLAETPRCHIVSALMDPSEHPAIDHFPSRGRVTHSVTTPARQTVRGELDGADVLIQSTVLGVWLEVAAATTAQAQELVDELKQAHQPLSCPGGRCRIEVWHQRMGGGHSTARSIPVPRWDEITANYPADVGRSLDRLMQLRPTVGRSGGLILFHGPPGTGKTTALRALLHEWSSWCDGAYVVDPEQLFSNAAYLVDVLAARMATRSDVAPRWRVLIAEDCDRYLRARPASGSGDLGRVLNVADGILGQEQNVLLLFTTNEDLTLLHPAVTRPGRCVANVEFAPFTEDEAEAWLGHRPPSAADLTLTALYEAKGAVELIGTVDKTCATGLYL